MGRSIDNDKFGLIFQFSCDPILILDPELSVVACNHAAEKFFRISIDQTGQCHFCDLFDCNQSLPQGYTVQEGFEQCLRTKKPVQGIELLVAGHEFRYGEISAFPIPFDEEWLLAIAIRDTTKNVCLRGQLEEWARTDPLTGLLNRRSLEKELARLITNAERYHEVFSLVMVDLDDLKKINDQFGHHAGDQAILDISKLLKSQLRPTDFIARYGGDEFVLLFPNTTHKQAIIAIQRIEDSLNQKNAESISEYSLGFSYGIAQWTKQTNVKELLEQADQLMYRQKKQKDDRTQE
ncbi:GGDEF domain-containing protein [Fodinisporobacter ferrooxydans]|uniref:GGDEF domain-containing protein n=1 Tax=Fodinisporobacter ferrooxydans TaxID=2901836 RepID=A0ABY4CQF4_9BACL|nr:GGDEF domain-containing protein [Alicyclobacillaceae bacterium MYW30-H2]